MNAAWYKKPVWRNRLMPVNYTDQFTSLDASWINENPAEWSIVNNKLRFTGNGATTYPAHQLIRPSSEKIKNGRISVDFTMVFDTNCPVFLFARMSDSSYNTGFFTRAAATAHSIQIIVNGANTLLVSSTIALTADTAYKLIFTLEDFILTSTLINTANNTIVSELRTIDSRYSIWGNVGLSAGTPTSAQVTAGTRLDYDNFSAKEGFAGYVNFSDTFDRANNADVNVNFDGLWTEETAAAFQILSNKCRATGQGSGGSFPNNQLKRPVADAIRDGKISVDFQFITGVTATPQLHGRLQGTSDNNGYMAYVGTNATVFAIASITSGTPTVIATLTITALTTTPIYRLSLEMTGSVITGRLYDLTNSTIIGEVTAKNILYPSAGKHGLSIDSLGLVDYDNYTAAEYPIYKVDFQDDFDRTDNAVVGNGWTEESAAAWAIVTTGGDVNTGKLRGSGGTYNTTQIKRSEIFKNGIIEVDCKFINNTSGAPNIHGRLFGSGDNSGYIAYVGIAASVHYLYLGTLSAPTSLGSFSLSGLINTTDTYRLSLEMIDDVITARIRTAGDITLGIITATSAAYPNAGKCGLANGGASTIIDFDNFSAQEYIYLDKNFSDNFTATTTPSRPDGVTVGNNWTEETAAVGQLLSGKLRATGNAAGFSANQIYRPVTESFRNGVIKVDFKLITDTTATPQLHGRLQGTNYGNGYITYWGTPNTFVLARITNGSVTVLASQASVVLTVNTNYQFTLVLQDEYYEAALYNLDTKALVARVSANDNAYLSPGVCAVSINTAGIVDYDNFQVSISVYHDNAVSYASSIDEAVTPLYMDVSYPFRTENFADLPVLIVMHGYNADRTEINEYMRSRLANNGLLVAALDMRGRGGSAGSIDVSGREIFDIYDAVEAIKTRYADIVDPTNICILGYSGGGGNTLNAIYKFPGMFSCAIDFFGMSDYGYDAVYGWYYTNTAYQGWLNTNIANRATGGDAALDKYRARMAFAGINNNNKTRIRIYHDSADPYVEVSHSQIIDLNYGYDKLFYTETNSGSTYRAFHAIPNANSTQQNNVAYFEGTFIPEIVSGLYKNAGIDNTGSWHLLGYVKTAHFQIFLGTGTSDAAPMTYDISKSGANTSNPKVFTINNNDTANAVTAYFELYNLTASTTYTIRLYNLTDGGSPSVAQIATDGSGKLLFNNAMAAAKQYQWKVSLGVPVKLLPEHLGLHSLFGSDGLVNF